MTPQEKMDKNNATIEKLRTRIKKDTGRVKALETANQRLEMENLSLILKEKNLTPGELKEMLDKK